MDYGTLMCWADNAVGQQKEPCVFHIIAAGKPDPPYNCTLVNQTSDGLEVDCNEGMCTLFKSKINMKFIPFEEEEEETEIVCVFFSNFCIIILSIMQKGISIYEHFRKRMSSI